MVPLPDFMVEYWGPMHVSISWMCAIALGVGAYIWLVSAIQTYQLADSFSEGEHGKRMAKEGILVFIVAIIAKVTGLYLVALVLGGIVVWVVIVVGKGIALAFQK